MRRWAAITSSPAPMIATGHQPQTFTWLVANTKGTDKVLRTALEQLAKEGFDKKVPAGTGFRYEVVKPFREETPHEGRAAS
jgi:hypothetical protein